MVDFSATFKEFLKKYDSAALSKVESDGTPPDVLNSIYSSYISKFETWEKLPPLLRDRYDVVPQDIMEAAARGEIETLRAMEIDPTLRTAEEAQEKVERERRQRQKDIEEAVDACWPYHHHHIPEDIILPAAAVAYTAAIVAGYSNRASHDMALESQIRNKIFEGAKGRNLTEEEHKQIIESHTRIRDIMVKDITEHQPERALIRMFCFLDRHPEKKDELLPKIADLVQKIETENRQGDLLKALQHPVYQAKLSRVKAETLDLMNSCLLKNVPSEMQNGYLANSIPIKKKLAELIDADNAGNATDIQARINDLVKDAKTNGIGIDFKNYSARSPHPMSAELRQKLMIACCVNDVPYRSKLAEKIRMDSEYFKSLPKDLQTLVAAKELQMTKGQIVTRDKIADTKELYANMPSIMAHRGVER